MRLFFFSRMIAIARSCRQSIPNTYSISKTFGNTDTLTEIERLGLLGRTKDDESY